MPKPLRVLHLAKLAPTEHGGIETVVGELLDAIPRQRLPVTLDCYCYAPQSSDEQLGPAVTLRRRRTTAVVASAPISLALLRSYRRARRNADLVHVHLPNPWAAVLVLALPTRAAVVASVHAASSRYGLLRRPHTALMRRLLSRADAIVVSASTNAALFELNPHRAKVTVIPYDIDPAR
jgi:glycosyltransferase involved in cell wall biosynthesis